jgi:hypothetical protein
MKLSTSPRRFLFVAFLSLIISTLSSFVCEAHPFASGLTPTNGSGDVSFILNENTTTVTVVLYTGGVAKETNSLGVLNKGPHTFNIGTNESYTISCFKTGGGVPVLISSDAYTNSQWANPRGVDAFKNPKNGTLFGRIFVGNAGPGGIAFGNPVFKGQGLYAYNADQTDAIGQGTNAAANSIYAPAGSGGNGPWRIRARDDDYTVMAGDDSIANAGLWMFGPDLSTNAQVLSYIGDAASKAAGTHGRIWGSPLMTGSLAGGNLVLYSPDDTLGAPTSTNCIKGPGTSPNSFNCLMRYDIGAGEYWVSNATFNFGVTSVSIDPNTRLLSATPTANRVATVALVQAQAASAATNNTLRLASVIVGSNKLASVGIGSNKLSTAAIVQNAIASAVVSSNVHLSAVSVGSSFFVTSAASIPNALNTIAVSTAGSGYKPGDILTISGGTGTAATVGVAATNGTGGITSITNKTAGNYSVLPNSTPNSPTGGSGTGALLNLTFGTGSGYAVGNVLTVVGGTGTPATVTVVTVNTNGVITAFAISAAGSYSVAPPATNSPTGGSGTGASLSLNIVGEGGHGYAVNDVLTLSGSVLSAAVNSTRLASISINAGGTGYTNGTVLTIAGGTGTAATVTVTATNAGNGAITAASITTIGTYTAAPVTPNSPTSTNGTGALLNLTMGTGTNYAVGNVLTIAGGTGTAASAVVTAVGSLGVITSVSVVENGAYTALPAAANSPTGGQGTTASLALTLGGSGTPATVRVASVNGNGGITSVTVVSNGNYSLGPVSPNLPTGGYPGAGGASLNLTFIGSGGTGYQAGDVLTVAGGTGTAATVTVGTVDGTGAITSLSGTTPGSYTALPALAQNIPTGGNGANVILTLTAGTGSGYLVNDVLTLAGGTGTPATLTVTNVSGNGSIFANGTSISSVGNYTAPPATPNSPTGGAGTGATLNLTMATGLGYTNSNGTNLNSLLTIAGGSGTAATISITAVNASGAITSVAIATNGLYSVAPTSPNSPTGSSGTGASLVFTITGGGGTNYSVNDVLTLAGGTGTNATLTVTSVDAGGAITGIAIASIGGYTAAPASPNSPTGGTGSNATVNVTFIGGTGSGYTVGDVLTLSGGTGTAATFGVASVGTAGVITSVTNISAGNYTVLPPTPNVPTGGTGSSALLNVTFGSGTGYTTSNQLTVSGGTGTAAIATISSVSGNGVITGISITNVSQVGNYTAAPSLTNSPTGGTGSGATLSLTMGSGINYAAGNALTIAGGTSTTAATATVGTIGNFGVITSISAVTPGNYTAAPASPNSPTGGAGTTASLNLGMATGAGTNYTAGDVLTLVGGVGTPATVNVLSVGPGGVITGVSIASTGNYTTPPATNNLATGGTGQGANLNFNLGFSAGTSAGSGYNVGDLLRITGGTSSISATVQVTQVTGGAITAVQILYPGDYSVAPPALNSPASITGSGSGATFNLTIAGPLNWYHSPNYAYTYGLDGIATLNTEFDLGKDGKLICGFGRANGSNPDIQILDHAGSNLLWTSWLDLPGGAAGPGGNNPSDFWSGSRAGGIVGLYGGVRVSPDGQFLGSQDLNNGITIANLTNGIPDDGSIFGITNAPASQNARGFCWDAADNVWSVSSGQGLMRCYSLGITTTCVTSNDYTAMNGSFELIKPGAAATVTVIQPTASQNYVNNTVNPGTPINGVFRISLNTGDLTSVGPVSVAFLLSGTATLGNQYSMLGNDLLANGVIVTTTSVIFPPTVNPAGPGNNWSVDIPIIPTRNPLSGPTTTVGLQVIGGTNYYASAPANGTVTILNTGPQQLVVSAANNGASMNRGIAGDYCKFTITRNGDINGPGNDSISVSPKTYTVTNFVFTGSTATLGLDYMAPPQVLYPQPPYGQFNPPTNGLVGLVTIPAGASSVTAVLGNPVSHPDPSQLPTNLTIVVNLTNTCNTIGSPTCNTNLTTAEGYPYTVTTASVTLNELDNTYGRNEVVLWSNPLTNSADSVNWTVTFASKAMGLNPVLPTVIPNYDNSQNDLGPQGINNDFIAGFGKPLSGFLGGLYPYSIPASENMIAHGWNSGLFVTVNKAVGAEAGLNLYPQGKVFQGNYAIRFDMYLSIYQYATNANNTVANIAAREYAAFGLNHYGTNCNWRLDANPLTPGTGSGPTNSDGVWCSLDAGYGAITPADFDLFTPPAIPNNHGAAVSGSTFLDQVSSPASGNAGIFKTPPFAAISPTLGGEPVNQWVDVSFEINAQTNLSLYVAKQLVLGHYALTNNFYGATGVPNKNGAYISGTPMLGYLDPNASIGDPSSSFAMYSNLRIVELSPYITLQPSVTNAPLKTAVLVPQFSSITLTSSVAYGTSPITNVWYAGDAPNAPGPATNGVPRLALQTNSASATNMADSLTITFNDASSGTNYMSIYSDPAGSVTSLNVYAEVVLGPTNRVYPVGSTNSFVTAVAGPLTTNAFSWYRNTSNNFATATQLANGAKYAGVATGTLTVNNIQPADAGFFWTVVSNSASGGMIVVTAPATLTVATAPTLAVVAPAVQVNIWGTNSTFAVTTISGTNPAAGGLTFQWKKISGGATNNLANNAHVGGATSISMTLSNITAADTASYIAGVSNSAGGVLSTIGVLTEFTPAPTITSVVTNGSGQVVMSFSSTNQFDTSTSFTLESAGVVTGPYTNNPAGVFSGSNPFQVIGPMNGDQLFYRIRHKD